MKYIDKNEIIDALQAITQHGVDTKAQVVKFFGLLEILSLLETGANTAIIPTTQYTLRDCELSESLQAKYFFGTVKAFNRVELMHVVFPKEWQLRAFQYLLKNKPLLLKHVAIICMQNEEFDDTITVDDIKRKFLDKYNLTEYSSLFFVDDNSNINLANKIVVRTDLFNGIKKRFSITTTSNPTFAFNDKLIAANPGELTRGPFTQPLYSGQENLNYILLSNIDLCDNYNFLVAPKPTTLTKSLNVIYFGAPGTGKSHKVRSILDTIPLACQEQVAFHPEYDHASFVGGYKPISEKDAATGIDVIKYKFVPQVFTDIYIQAWENPGNNYVLVIEEINRGNCAEIFGDLFHLLDRKSRYSISPSKELREHLENKLSAGSEGIKGGKMKLPDNLRLIATMNTSDQSLFPMDSAFKRRWSWEYIPICYDALFDDGYTINESHDYVVHINPTKSFKWIDFIQSVNTHIKSNPNLGMDKCIGNYFIKSDTKVIELEVFINKVIFYLWNDVFKDEDNEVFPKGVYYEDFFPIKSKGVDNLIEILDLLLIPITPITITVSPATVTPGGAGSV